MLLTAPLTDDGRPVIGASGGGDDRHPGWFLDLRDEPAVQVSVQGGPRTPMIARIASPEDRARMWPQIAGRCSDYAGHQRRTDREIPLVVLEPAV